MKKHENAKELNELELKEVTGGHNATPRIIPGYKKPDIEVPEEDTGIVFTSIDGWDGKGPAGVTATWDESKDGGATGGW